jgi:hypothetical protein
MKDTSSIPADLASLLADLPPESLRVLEEFARFLHEQARLGQRIEVAQGKDQQQPYLYPTVSLPASSLDELIGIMPPAGGDALEDSESLYNGN